MFVDIFKRALKTSNGMETEEARIQQFLSVYRITSNSNTVKPVFTQKIKSVFDKLLPGQKQNFQITLEVQQNISGLKVKFSSGCLKEEENFKKIVLLPKELEQFNDIYIN